VESRFLKTGSRLIATIQAALRKQISFNSTGLVQKGGVCAGRGRDRGGDVAGVMD